MAITTVKYAPHPLAELFPRPTAEEQRELTEHIRKSGLEENVVLFQGKVLDGLSRQVGCANAGRPCRYVEFMDLSPEIKEAGPLAYVIGRNLRRRHLSVSQRAAIATEMIPAMEREMRRQRNGDHDPAISGPAGPLNGEEEAPRRRGRPPKSVSLIKAAAAALNVGERSVKRARKLKKEQPEKFKAVKAGKATLGGEEAKSTRATEKAKDRADAIARIRQCCGDLFAEAVERGSRLKNHAELLEFAAQHKPDMVAQQGLIELGWTLKKAQKFRAKDLTMKHTLADLANKAASSGMTYEIVLDGWKFEVNREKVAK